MSSDTVMWQSSNFFVDSSREIQPNDFGLSAVWKSVRMASFSAKSSIFIIIRKLYGYL